MRRRIQRIAVPYLASLALAEIVKLSTTADLYNGSRSLSPLSFWIRNLTLTQWSYLTVRWMETGEGLATPWFNPVSHFIQQRFGWAVADGWVLSLVLVSAYGFYRLFEKPFLNRALTRSPGPALVVASTTAPGR